MTKLDASLPEGFDLHRKWVKLACRAYMENLMNEVHWDQPTIRMFGETHTIPRKVAWMGRRYSYSGITHEPTPWHPDVLLMCTVLEKHFGHKFNSCLLNRYDGGGHSVAWHSDDEPELGNEPVIASVSFGWPRRFAVKEKAIGGKRWNVMLEEGDLLIMSGRSQRDYQHCLPKTRMSVGPRINLTFRKIIDQ